MNAMRLRIQSSWFTPWATNVGPAYDFPVDPDEDFDGLYPPESGDEHTGDAG